MTGTRFLRARVVRDVVVSAAGVVRSDGRPLSGTGSAATDSGAAGSGATAAHDALPPVTARLEHAVFAGRMPTMPARLVLDGFSRLWLRSGGPSLWVGDDPFPPLLDGLADMVDIGPDRRVVGAGSVSVGELLVLDPAFTPQGVHPVLVERVGSIPWTGAGSPRVWVGRSGGGDEVLEATLRDDGWSVVSPMDDGLEATVRAIAGATRVAGRPAALLCTSPLVRGLGATVEPVAPEPHPLVDVAASAWRWTVVPHRTKVGDASLVVEALRA